MQKRFGMHSGKSDRTYACRNYDGIAENVCMWLEHIAEKKWRRRINQCWNQFCRQSCQIFTVYNFCFRFKHTEGYKSSKARPDEIQPAQIKFSNEFGARKLRPTHEHKYQKIYTNARIRIMWILRWKEKRFRKKIELAIDDRTKRDIKSRLSFHKALSGF